MIKKLCAMLISFFLLTSCVPVQPIKNKITPINELSVTYTTKDNANINNLVFGTFTNTQPNGNFTGHNGISVKINQDQTMLVTAFNDNGVAGSKNEYTIKYEVKNNTIILTPISNLVNQDGLVLPKPIPNFSASDLINFLSTTKYEFDFEINSEFPSDSINANFKRLLTSTKMKSFQADKSIKNPYILEMPEADVNLDVKLFPYRNGSKATIHAIYYTKPANVIVLKEIEDKIKKRVTEIINS